MSTRTPRSLYIILNHDYFHSTSDSAPADSILQIKRKQVIILHYNRILTICLTIAAWTWVILKYPGGSKRAAPLIITILRWLADQIEYLIEGNTQLKSNSNKLHLSLCDEPGAGPLSNRLALPKGGAFLVHSFNCAAASR